MEKSKEGMLRRDFLKIAGTAAPAAIAAVAVGAGEAEAAATPETSGMRKTAHVQRYLDSARF
jgi:hypothetical protein